MPVTAGWYGNALISAFDALIDVESHTMKVMLLDGTHTSSQDTHDTYTDVSGDEVSSAGYTVGGFTLVSSDQAYGTPTSKVWQWTAGNPSWTGVSFTTEYAVYYDTVATQPLMSFVNFGADQVISSANFSITHDAAGIVKLTITTAS